MERILLLVKNPKRRRLLLAWLGQDYEVISATLDQGLEGQFGLAVVDHPALEQWQDRLEVRKAGVGAAFLPFLLVASRKELEKARPHLGGLVDEVLLTPLAEAELQVRVAGLLKARRLSLEADQRYYALAEGSQAGVYIIQERRMVYANAAFTRMQLKSGLNDTDFLARVHSEERRQLLKEYRKLRTGRGGGEAEEIYLPTPSGPLWVESVVTPILHGGRSALLGIVLDISARKQAEEELRRTEQEIACVLDSMTDLVVYQDLEMKLVWVNRAAAASVGLTSEDLAGRHCYEVWHQRRAPCPGCPVVRARESGQPQEGEVVSPDGRVWIIRGYPVRDSQGNLEAMVEVTTDITAPKRAQEALRHREEHYRLIVETAEEGIGITDAAGRITFVNQKLADLMGYPVAEIVGRPVADFLDEADRARLAARITERRRGLTEKYEIAYRRRDGSPLWTITSASPLFDPAGAYLGSLAMITDITRRKENEAAIRKSEERYRLFFEQSPLGVFHFDRHGIVRECNDNFVEIIGSSREKLLGFNMAASLKDEALRREVLLALEGKTGFYEGDYHSVTADKVTPVKVHLNAITSPSGEFLGGVGLVEDITAHRRAEEAVRESRATLQAVFQGSGMGIALMDPAGRFVEMNPALQEMLGYGPDEFRQKSFREIVAPEDLAMCQALFQDLGEGKISQARLEKQFVRRDGGRVWGRHTVSAIRNAQDHLQFVVCLVEDISERKRTEDEIRDLAKFPEENPNPVLRLDGTGRLLYANPESLPLLQEWGVAEGYPVPAWLHELTQETLAAQITRSVDLTCDDKIFLFVVRPVMEGGYVNLYGTDITLRRRTEQALLEREAQYRLLVETMNEGVNLADDNDIITYTNDRFCEMLGYSREEVVGRPCTFFVDDINRRKIEAEFEKRKTGSHEPYDLEAIRKDGGKVTLLVSPRPLFDEMGGFKGSFAVLTDITARKRAEDTLKDLIFRAPIGIYIVQEGKFALVNPGFEKITGYRAEELVGQQALTMGIVSPDFLESVRANAVRMLKGERSAPYEYQAVSKGGARKWIMETVTPTRFAGERATLGYFMDITALKEAKEALEEAQERLRFVVSASPAIIYSIDIRGDRVSFISPNIAAQLGYEPEEVLKDNRFWLDRLHPEDMPRILAERQLFLEQGKDFNFGEYRFRHRDGAYHWMHDEVKLLRDRNGQPVELVGAWYDITDRKAAEAELQKSQEKLRQSLEGIVNVLAGAIELRDPYTAGHQLEVARLAQALAQELGLPEARQEGLHLAGLVHDIGKIQVPAEILSKPGSLTAIEFGLVKNHSQAGYELLKAVDFPWPIALMVRQHHERLDGSGYPQGLRGEEIMLEARILAVADVVEAMAHHRPYRPAIGLEKALAEIHAKKGVIYDAEVVEACLRLFREGKFWFD